MWRPSTQRRSSRGGRTPAGPGALHRFSCGTPAHHSCIEARAAAVQPTTPSQPVGRSAQAREILGAAEGSPNFRVTSRVFGSQITAAASRATRVSRSAERPPLPPALPRRALGAQAPSPPFPLGLVLPGNYILDVPGNYMISVEHIDSNKGEY